MCLCAGAIPGHQHGTFDMARSSGAARHSQARVLEVSGGMIRGCWHCFLPSWCPNRRRGASSCFCFQDMDQQLGEVRPAPFALASAKLDVQHHVI